jgi:secondary thiamine-phosphate synthase enzyme
MPSVSAGLFSDSLFRMWCNGLIGCFEVHCQSGVNRVNQLKMRQLIEELTLRTRGRGFSIITSDVSKLVKDSGIVTGLVTLQLQHTSASLLIQENADPDVRCDLESWFSRLVSDGDPIFEHTMEGKDDMAAHIRTALTAVNLSIPIHRNRLALGTWQGIYLWEHRYAPHTRTIIAHLIGE